MRYLTTLMLTESGPNAKLIALSPDDDIYVVLQDDATPDMIELGESLAKQGGLIPFAHIFKLEPSKQ